MQFKSGLIGCAAATAALLALPAVAKPTISWQAPAPGGTLSGNVQGPPHCVVTGSDIARVMFYIDGVWTNTDGNLSNGLGCWIDTTKHADGSYTLKAVAYNSKGQTATAWRNVVINNPPTISWQAPVEGGPLSGNVQGPPHCIVTGTNIAKVMFYINGAWTNTDGNLSNGLGCWIDTTKYPDGGYTLKAVAYNSLGATAEATRNIVIANNSGGPTISWQAPAEGGPLSGNVQGPPNCVVTGTNVSYVRFYINGAWTNTDGNLENGLGCWIDTTTYANGPYTLKAVAYDDFGNSAEATRGIVIENGASTPAAIDAADILSHASAESAFAEQSGYNVQVLGTHQYISGIAETGVHGSVLPNGETLRFGKVVDPLDSAKKGLAFQVHPGDPDTSGANRTELRMPDNIEMDKVYWIALSVYVYDWGTLALEDRALFGTQIHSGDNSLGLSPSFSIYTLANGRNLKIQARWSTDARPTPSNSVAINYAETTPIPFGRWVDFVFRFKHNVSGAGFLQAWMDGTQIVEHQGNLGFYTPGYKDYAKFGYYNWSSEMNSARKVLLRSPTLVADPTGTKYTHEQLRAHIHGAH